jgi:hypothetical protein
VRAAGKLRVCIWPDYYGITYRNPRTQQLGGIDIDLSAELGARPGRELEYVETSFPSWSTTSRPTLRRGDVRRRHAAGTRRPAGLHRALPAKRHLRRDEEQPRGARVGRHRQPGVQVAVQAGTFMEPVMRRRSSRHDGRGQAAGHARAELEAGRVDVFMTDYPYSRRLLDNADWATLVSPPKPFHVLRAYAVKQGDDALAGAAGRVRRAHQARRAPRGGCPAPRPGADRRAATLIEPGP